MNFFEHKWLPATVISRKPYVFSAFLEDVANKADFFKIWFECYGKKHKSVSSILTLGFQYETQERMEDAKILIKKIQDAMPSLHICIFCNSEVETKNFRDIGCEALYCSHNAFLREYRYPIVKRKKIYDAVYLARITPFKRHELALKVSKLLLIGTYSNAEKDYAKSILSQLPDDAEWQMRVRGILLFWRLSQARVGLCLSAAEGAMYACTEYALCGLPIVSTKNLGGRLNSVSSKYSLLLENDSPTPEDIADAVKEQIAKNFSPHEVKMATIKKLEEHRAKYRQYMRQYFERTKEGNERDFEFAMNFPHKMGVRCRTSFLFKLSRSLYID